MSDNRIQKGVRRGPEFEIQVDGEKTVAHEGETVAAALMAGGKADLRRNREKKRAQGGVLRHRPVP